MPDLKLPRLPERTPVKHTIVVMPDLEQKLRDYAEFYRVAYNEAVSVDTLIPFIVDAFLESDRGFTKVRKKRTLNQSKALDAKSSSRELKI